MYRNPVALEVTVSDFGPIQILRCGVLLVAVDAWGHLLDVAVFTDGELRRVSVADERRLKKLVR